MTRLFIFDKEVELDNTVQFSITKQFEDMSNPTVIINDWSKTVEIPATRNNTILFGHIFSPDRIIPSGSITPIGLYFDPTKKLDFRLEWNENVVMTGYAKFNTVSRKQGKTTYNITLNGQLGKVFQELKNLSFNRNAYEPAEAQYIIDGSKYISNYITKDLVKESWTHNQTYLDLQDALDNNDWTSIIGFACNANNYNDDFDSKTVLTYTDSKPYNHTESLAEILASSPSFQATNLSAEQVIGNGLLPRQFSEFRSYYQQPFIYFNKLWQIFFNEAKTLTGYDVDMDTTWFNNSNPYWTKSVMMLKNLDVKDGDLIDNGYYNANVPAYSTAANAGDFNTRTLRLKPVQSQSTVTKDIVEDWTADPIWFKTDDDYSVRCSINTTFSVRNYSNALELKDDEWLKLVLNCVGEDGVSVGRSNVIYVIKQGGQAPADADVVVEVGRSNEWIIPINFTTEPIHKYRYGSKFRIELKQSFSHPLPYVNNSLTYYHLGTYEDFFSDGVFEMKINFNDKVKRSYNHFTLNDLWNNDYNLFDSIINYCKMFRLYVSIDDANKKILVRRSSTYFSDYTISNWDDKLDMSKEFVITPISWVDKYIRFNYKDSDVERIKQYAEKFGVQYGELKLATDYNFNTNETNIIENSVHDSINATENILLWQNMYQGNIVYNYMNEVYPCSADKDGKRVDNFGALYFHNGIHTFELLDTQQVKLSDDTPFEQINNNYCYNDLWKTSDYSDFVVDVNSYPQLSVIYADDLILWNTPKEVYDRQDYNNKNGIFKNMWEKYVNERYNIQNKKVTCYLKFTPTDFINFDYNHFIQIGNQLYVINKIYDYNIDENTSTKVDLLTIQDISNYTTDNFNEITTDFISDVNV